MSNYRKVAVFWDYENCSPPVSSQGHAIVNGIRRIAHVFGCVTTFKAYLDMSVQSSKSSVAFRSVLQSSGVSLIDCPHNGRKDVVDKMILVDMLAFAIDHHSPATVILISGDRDYAYAISTLRLRQYTVVLIVPPSQNIPHSLESQASVVIDWNYAILGKRSDVDTLPVRQPHRDLDADTVERLACEIRDSNEDPAVTLISSSYSTSTTPTHTRRISAAERFQPSVFQRNTDSNDAVQPAPMWTPKKATSIFPEIPAHSGVGSVLLSAAQSTQAVPGVDQDPGSPFTANDAILDGSNADECVSTANEIQDMTHHPFTKPPVMTPRLERYQDIAEPGSPPTVNLTDSPPSSSPAATCNLGSRATPLHLSPHSPTISRCTTASRDNSPQPPVPAAMPLPPVPPTDWQNDATTPPESINTSSVLAIMDDSTVPSDYAALMGALGLDDEDDNISDGIANVSTYTPPLTGVDDPLRAYVMNPAELYLNRGQSSVEDIMKSPANDASELSGTPTSQISSLTPSVSNPNVTMTDVGIDSSSGCQALPIESTEDKIQRLTQFLPLVNQLLMARSKGIMKPARSNIADALVQHDKDVYKRVGLDRFGEYAWKAEKASIVELGGRESQGEPAWIALHPSWFKTNSPTLLTVQSNDPPPPQTNTKISTSSAALTPPPITTPQSTTQKPKTPTPPPSTLRQRTKRKQKIPTPPPSTLPQPATPKPKTPIPTPPPSTLPTPKPKTPTPPPSTLPQPTTPKPKIPIPPSSTLPKPTTPKPKTPILSAMSDRPIPFCFYPLITCLVNVHKAGMTQPLLSSVGLVLGPVAYARAGASSLQEYLALAMDAEVVECGGADGSAWVRLYPDVLSGQRCF